MTCRFCSEPLNKVFLDLINSPPSNSFLKEEQLSLPEVYYPLKLYVCNHCKLVQLDEYKKAFEIFNSDYAYFSSYSTSWLAHAKKYSENIIQKLKLNNNSLVIELASNDGYLLQYFVEKNIPILGIEPSANVAIEAEKKGVKTLVSYFNIEVANELVNKNKIQADLLIGNNVLAHVPDINNFVQGMKILLKKNGVVTMEFPHLYQLVLHNQFDTVYHEHYSYLSFHTVSQIFEKQGLQIFDVEEIPTHGGSLRIYVGHFGEHPVTKNIHSLQEKEKKSGMLEMDYYTDFQHKADKLKYELLQFLITQKQKNQLVLGYGAAAKGNTFLNYCGIKPDLLPSVIDASPYKQGRFLPGSHIPVHNESLIKKLKPAFILILPWNIKDEIINQLAYISEWDGKFVTAVPQLNILQ